MDGPQRLRFGGVCRVVEGVRKDLNDPAGVVGADPGHGGSPGVQGLVEAVQGL